MGKKMIRFVTVLLAAAISFTNIVWAADVENDPVLRVGLFYGSAALPGANLENSVGGGYRFGYFDDSLDFVQLGYTAETQISMVKTQNVTLSGGNYVDGNGGVTVGCFHVQFPMTYSSFEEAQSAASMVQNGFPAWIDGVYYVRAGAYATKEEALDAQMGLGGEVVGTSGYAVTVAATKTGRPLFQLDGGADYALGVMPGLTDGEETVTWCKGYRYYGGFQYLRQEGGNLTVMNMVRMEDYLKGVVQHEMSPDWPLEALKAQAVCARTYAYINRDKHRQYGFDVCNTTDCQVYWGLVNASGASDRAVEETAGQYVWYGNELAETYYSACDGGATEDAVTVWGFNGKELPYLKGVADPYEADVSAGISQYNWTKTVSKTAVAETLRSKGYNCASIVDAYVSELSPTGNPKTVTFVDSSGKKWSIAKMDSLRVWFGLRSNRFTIGAGAGVPTGETWYVNGASETLPALSEAYAVDGTGNVAAISGTPYVATASGTGQAGAVSAPGGGASSSGSSVTFTGSGHGHNVGMSQQGARAMALRGMDYEDILTFYFTGVTIR